MRGWVDFHFRYLRCVRRSGYRATDRGRRLRAVYWPGGGVNVMGQVGMRRTFIRVRDGVLVGTAKGAGFWDLLRLWWQRCPGSAVVGIKPLLLLREGGGKTAGLGRCGLVGLVEMV
jgi:hypothetical protein